MIQTVSSLPEDSRISEYLESNGFSDCFSVEFTTKGPLKVDEVVRCFFLSTPNWVKILFSVRERIASALNLKTSESEMAMLEKVNAGSFQINDRFGLFKIYAIYPDEIIMGEDDSHLNFRVSWYVKKLYGNEYRIFCSTTVQINNLVGKIYFFLVKPFHKLVVKSFLKNMVKSLSAK